MRVAHYIFAITALLAVLAGPAAAQAPARHALLIGNQAYSPKVGALTNPHNDVALLEAALKKLGFTVTVVRDARLGATNIAINRYLRTLSAAGPGAVGFFYYSGHGAADGTTNYLIPVDATSTDTAELWDQSLRLGEITRRLKVEAGNATHFVVFDACRNTLKLKEAGKRAAVQAKGFRAEREQPGMLISYATAEGELASDVGQGAGPYAKVLAEEIVTPGIEAVTMFRNVQRRVRAAIRQEPYLGFNALGDVYFAGKEAAKPAVLPALAAPQPPLSEAAQAWAVTKDTTSVAVLEAFAAQYRDTVFANLARARVEELKRQKPVSGQSSGAPQAGSGGGGWWDRLTGGGQPSQPAPAEPPPSAPSAPVAAPPRQVAAHTPPAQRPATAAPRCDGIELVLTNSGPVCIKPGPDARFKDCPTCPEMVVVPAGSFMMGSNDFDSEKPIHKVTIASPFAVGKFEVTFDEWDACVGAGGCSHKPSDQGWGRGRRPVINVLWDDAKQYVAWLSKATGKGYRLLSEAEWEYAARAGTRTRYAWGNDAGRGNANCDGCGSQWDNEQTAPAGSFKPNAFGLHDMHGNVREWVQDCWNGDYKGAPGDGAARTGGDCSLHVLRGGSWDIFPQSLRSADRFGLLSDFRRVNMVGFRVARVLSR